MRIAVWASSQMVNSNYRAFPYVALLKRGHEVHLDVERDADVEQLKGFDVVLIYRHSHAEAREVARALRKAGVAVVWDNDDDLTEFDDGVATKRGALRSQSKRSDLVRMTHLAHVVTTSSETLAQQYRTWGVERVRVVENYIPATFSATDVDRAAERVVVGWTAGGEHEHDKKSLQMSETLQRLLDTHQDVEVRSVGIDLGLRSDRYRHVVFAQYRHLASLVAAFDIGIAPIADTPYNRARSNVKVKEYASVGVPWLASPIGPYRGLGERQGGRLVPDGDWYAEIERLVRDARARRKLAKRAAKWGREQTVLANLARLEEPLREAAALTA